MIIESFSIILCNFLYWCLKISSRDTFPPPLSPEEERKCFLLYKKGDMKARTKLIEHNLRLVAHIVKKYYSQSHSQEDLISIGTIGLIKAIDTYDIEKGSKFATYASKCLQNEILMSFRCQKKLGNEVSINEAIDIDKDGNPLSYMDIICSNDSICEDVDFKTKSSLAKYIIQNDLSKREKQIIVLRYGLGAVPAITQREVALKLGISRSYVSRIEKSALQKIAAKLKRYGYTSL